MGIYQSYLFVMTIKPGILTFAFASLAMALSLFWIAYGLEKNHPWASQAAVGWAFAKVFITYLLMDRYPPLSEYEFFQNAFFFLGYLGAPPNVVAFALRLLDHWILPLLVLLLVSPIIVNFFDYLKDKKTFAQLLDETFANRYFIYYFCWTSIFSAIQVGGVRP